MNISRQLAQQTFTPGQDTGAQLQLRDLPADLDGGAVYVRAINFRLHGTVTVPNSTATINWARLVRQFLLTVPGVATFVNVSGDRAVRLYRVRNSGNFPPCAATSPFGGAHVFFVPGDPSPPATQTIDVDVTFVVEFSALDGRKLDDNAIPARLLQSANLKVTFGASADIGVTPTAGNLALDTTVDLVRQRELRIPALPIIDSVELQASKQPAVDACDGRITHALIQPSDEFTFDADDYGTLGLSFGELKLTEDTYPTDGYYDAFNRLAETDIVKHEVDGGDCGTCIPLVFAPGGKNGQHITYEAVPAGTKPRLLTDVAANPYALVRRYVLPRSHPAYKAACQLLRVSPSKAKTASHKPAQSSAVSDYVPGKVVATN